MLHKWQKQPTSERKEMGILLSKPRTPGFHSAGAGGSALLLCKCPVKLFILTVHFLSFSSSVNCPQFRNLWRDESQIAETHQCLSRVTFQRAPGTDRGRSFSSGAKSLLPQVWAWLWTAASDSQEVADSCTWTLDPKRVWSCSSWYEIAHDGWMVPLIMYLWITTSHLPSPCRQCLTCPLHTNPIPAPSSQQYSLHSFAEGFLCSDAASIHTQEKVRVYFYKVCVTRSLLSRKLLYEQE